MEKYTMGRYPENKALHWNNETHLRLGKAIFLLSQCNPAEWKIGWLDFICMRHLFFEDEWTTYLKKIDLFRIQHGAMSVMDVVEDVAIHIDIPGAFKNAKPRDLPLPIVWPEKMLTVVLSDLKEEQADECGEQLSLF